MSSRPSLFELQSMIDAAWEENHSLDLVPELAAQHPRYAEELYAFADALRSEDEPLPHSMAEVALRAAEAALAAAAQEAAPQAAPLSGGPPQNLLAFLAGESGLPPSRTAAALEAPLSLLICFSDHPRVVARRAREELAARAERALGIARERVLSKFDEPPPLALAASRQGPMGADPTTYDELLDRARLNPAAREAWNAFA